ncbi:hypothetical protein [Pseudomonas spirodelae]|uniref:Cytochrome c domain-containing protein n=1 Tax=Pseudomonas spirodelae TaxID=3101751 RepID=A0ABU5P7F5_9PSED|nr:hypothetical protein [Pseudomonas sp. T5W1]MEA1605601.1 hypothetical protein [Pseudomonas sp. T5W1]
MLAELQEIDFPEVYARFVDLFPDKPWLKATSQLQMQLRANPLSAERIESAFMIAYGLSHFERGGMSILGSEVWPSVQLAMGFAAQVCGLVSKALDERGRKAYLGRVSGAFANPIDMRALRFEHLTAMTLHKRGAQIEWPDESSGDETFDILASTEGFLSFEVECKSCSADKGRPITESEASEFLYRMMRELTSVLGPKELMALKVRVPKRLPTSHKALDTLVAEVMAAIRDGQGSTESGALLAFSRMMTPDDVADPQALTHLVSGLAAREWGDLEGPRAYFIGGSTPSGFCIEVCSGRKLQILDAMSKTAKHAVRTQMTGTRPGCLVLRLEGLNRDELTQLAQEVPNPLAWFATHVLKDERHEHLACLAFISDEEATRLSESTVTAQSSSYFFDSPVGRYPNLGIGRTFLSGTS